MKFLKILVALALVTSVIACGQKQQNDIPVVNKKSTEKNIPTTESKKPIQTLEGWKSYQENNYVISYPPNWAISKTGQAGSSFILVSAPTSAKDNFRETINLLVQDLAGVSFDLDKYIEISEDQIETLVTDGIILESKRMRDETLEYHKIIYSGTQGNHKLKFQQYYWAIGDIAYVLTFTCDELQFDNNLVTAEKIMDSFRFTDL
jgi:predicted small lipoprotein YifL